MKRFVVRPSLALASLVLVAGTAKAVPIFDVVFQMDRSTSISAAGWAQEKSFVSALITTGLPATDRIAVQNVMDSVAWNFKLNNVLTRTQMVNTVNGLAFPSTPTTNATLDAFIDAANEFQTDSPADHLKLLFMLTDGNPNPVAQNPCGSGTSAQNMRAKLDALNVRVIFIGVGPDRNTSTMSCLLEDPTTDYIDIAEFTGTDLANIKADMIADAAAAAAAAPAPGGALLFGLGAAALLRRRPRGRA